MRAALAVLMLLLLAPWPTGEAASPEPRLWQPHLDPVAALLLQSPEKAFLASLEAQGVLAAQQERPPRLDYRDVQGFCDVDGDGTRDALVNELDLNQPPRHGGSPSRVQAVSGANGSALWTQDNLFFMRLEELPDVSLSPKGRPFPEGPGTAAPILDVDDDGVCDVLAFGYETDLSILSTPLLGDPSVRQFDAVVRLLSGNDGSVLWERVFDGARASHTEPLFNSQNVRAMRNFPTGFLAYDTADGPRFVLKTTDLDYVYARDPLGLRGIRLFGRIPVTDQSPHVEDVKATDHLILGDAKTGETLWTHDLAFQDDAKVTNLTWLAGARDLTGDGTPDLVVHQMVLATPRGSEPNNPVGGDKLFRYGRGMRVAAVDGASGAALWTSLVLDPLAPRPNLQQEESYETLVWTDATLVPDLDGDGLADVVGAYVAAEEGLAGTPFGTYRTHFIALQGKDGALRWDVRQQGWGALAPLDGDGNATTTLGLGVVDIPVSIGGQPTPPQNARLAAIRAADGQALWSVESQFAEGSVIAYNLALAQFETSLAPWDWDADGLRDLVAPARATPVGVDQVLLATSNHTYTILRGSDGSDLRTLKAFGIVGRVLACDGMQGDLLVVSGHARRLDAQRFDAQGALQWRRILHQDPAPRGATTGIDMTGLGATCRMDAGETLLGLDLQAWSFARGHEVVAVEGIVEADGTPRWMTPPPPESAPADALFLAAAADPGPGPAAKWSLVVGGGAALGALLGVASALALARLRPGVLGALFVAALFGLALVPGEAPTAAALGAPTLKLPTTAPLPSAGAPDPRADIAAFAQHARAGYAVAADPPASYRSNDTRTYAYAAPDLDGDGARDYVLNQHCLDFSCRERPADLVADFVDIVTDGSFCSYPHNVLGVSSATGDVLWRVDLHIRAPLGSCAQAFVIGTMPLGEGRMGILVYNYTVLYPALIWEQVDLHAISMIDAADGRTLWTFEERGTWQSDLAATVVAKNWVIYPAIADGPEPAIFLQGVGFRATVASTLLPLPPLAPLTSDPVTFADVYQPDEWAARLDPATGDVLWRGDTFQAEPSRSVLPTLLDTSRIEQQRGDEAATVDGYWRNAYHCCADTTGDGVPDLVYRTVEWTATPSSNVQGPFDYDATLVVRDGATGALALDVPTRKDFQVADGGSRERAFAFTHQRAAPAYRHALVNLGDVDGDGADDLLQNESLSLPEHMQVLSVLSGRDGRALWNVTGLKQNVVQPMGDADGDGATDLLVTEWFGFEFPGETREHYATPQEVPVRMLSGRTGAELWRSRTFEAPADFVEVVRAMQRNGVMDVDGDGMGDVPVDDPVYLADQTVVHRRSFLSGRDGSVVFELRTVGSFSVPMRAGDADGDGRDEVAILGGDANDLWMTLHAGGTGQPLWSRRILALPTSGYAEALPQMRVLLTPTVDAGAPVLLTDFHLSTMSPDTFIGISLDADGSMAAGEVNGFFRDTLGQTYVLDAREGLYAWALPEPNDIDLAARVDGAAPGVRVFDELLRQAQDHPLSVQGDAMPRTIAGLAAFILMFALAGAATTWLRRQRALDKGVPDLD